MKLETIAVHAGAEPDPRTGSISPPIELSTTFLHGPEGEGRGGYVYVRDGNPADARLEQALAAVEGGEAALAFSSGMAAGTAYLQALPQRTHVIFHSDIYYTFRQLAADFLPRWDVEASACDLGDLSALQRELRPETGLIWAETPTNPLMQIVDLRALAGVARQAGAALMVDGTFATPVLQRPLELGADVVLHSTTKYLGGHSDVQGGALIFKRRDERFERVLHNRRVLGAVASPFNSWLVLRGLRSLGCRVERHSSNALAVARALERHPAVETVHYPGLDSHPGHEVASRQMKAFGGMLSFRLAGGREQAVRVASRVKLFLTATSLGGTESLIEHRASMEGPASKTPQNLLRVSVGLEHPDDLIEDLTQALA